MHRGQDPITKKDPGPFVYLIDLPKLLVRVVAQLHIMLSGANSIPVLKAGHVPFGSVW